MGFAHSLRVDSFSLLLLERLEPLPLKSSLPGSRIGTSSLTGDNRPESLGENIHELLHHKFPISPLASGFLRGE